MPKSRFGAASGPPRSGTIEDWAPTPVNGQICITGVINGSYGICSPIEKMRAPNIITTRSGSVYRLGQMDPMVKVYMEREEKIDTSTPMAAISGALLKLRGGKR